MPTLTGQPPDQKSEIRNPKSEILIPISFRGLSGFCTAWAEDNEGTVYASFIGRVTALTGIWAAFMDNVMLWLDDGARLFKRPKVENAKYHTLRVRLPESDWLHLVLLHSQATMQNLPDLPFYVLTRTPEPPIDAFWIQWNNALPLPALQEWTSHLWDQGIHQELIVPCPAAGTHCWKVMTFMDTWGDILQKIVMEGGV